MSGEILIEEEMWLNLAWILKFKITFSVLGGITYDQPIALSFWVCIWSSNIKKTNMLVFNFFQRI